MDTVRHLLLEENGTDRIKFEFDFDDSCKNKETFTCRRCGRHEYRNGEFETIKLGDIFTHITRFPSGSLPGDNNLCTQCGDGTELSENDASQSSEPAPSPAPPPQSQIITNNHNNNNNNNDSSINNNNNITTFDKSLNSSVHAGLSQHTDSSITIPGLVSSATLPVIKIERDILEGTTDESGRTVVLLNLPPIYDAAQNQHHHDPSSLNGPSAPPSNVTFNPDSGDPQSQVTSQKSSMPPSYTVNMVNSILETSRNTSGPGGDPLSFMITHSPKSSSSSSGPTIKIEDAGTSSTGFGSSLLAAGGTETSTTSATTTITTGTGKGAGEGCGRDASTSSTIIKSRECLICNKTFKSFKIAQLHFERVHEKEGKFCCHICGIRFSYRGSLDSHLAAHKTPEVTHNCPDCGQKFKVKSNLVNHMKVHADNPKKFLCDFCPSTFAKRVNLRCHVKRKHPEMMDNSSSATTAPALNNKNNNTSNSTSSNNNNTQGTGISNTLSQSPSGATSNNMSHSYTPLISATTKPTSGNNKDKPQGSFKCEHCGRSFLFKNNLKAHLRTHTRDKKYTCEICEKSFIYKESLKNHMLLHSNELPYHCDICGKKFRDRSNRRKHVKNVHKYMFMNGEVNSTGIPTGTFIQPPGSAPPGKNSNQAPNSKVKPGNGGQQQSGSFQPPEPPKKKRSNKNKNTQQTLLENPIEPKGNTGKPNNSKKKNNAKQNVNARNNVGQSVIVSAAGTGVTSTHGMDQDQKIIVSPRSKIPNSPMEYSQLPVTVHVPSTVPSGLHHQYVGSNRDQHVIVKTETNSQDMDMFQRGQNVIVYPKSKDYQNPGVPHNDHVSQPQYYTEEYTDPNRPQGPPQTYLTLPVASMTANSPNSESRPANMVFEFVHPSQIGEEGEQRMQVTSIPYPGSENLEAVQYSSHAYAAPVNDPNYHNTLQHSDQHQYWTVVNPADTNNPTVQITTNVSSPSSAPAFANTASVAYDSPITAASNVLNAPSYAHAEGTDPTNSNFYYKDLSQFDFSYL